MWIYFIDVLVYLKTKKIPMKQGKTMDRECL